MKTPPPFGSKPPKPDINKCNPKKTVDPRLDYYTIHKNLRLLKTILNYILVLQIGFLIGFIIAECIWRL